MNNDLPNLPNELISRQRPWYRSNVASRSYIFRIKNPGIALLNDFDRARISFMVYQLERGTSGTPHFQGLVNFKGNTKINAAKKLIGAPNALLEPSRNFAKCYKYVTKKGSRIAGPYEFGIMPDLRRGPRRQKNAEVIPIEALQSGSNKTCIDEYEEDQALAMKVKAWIKMKCKNVKDQNPKNREPCTRSKMTVFYLFGASMTGKTELAKQTCSVLGWSYYVKVPGSGWTGYRGEEAVIMDYLCPGDISIQKLNSMINMDVNHIPGKGGTKRFTSTILIFVSNYSFERLFIEDYNSIFFSLKRRVDIELHFENYQDQINVTSSERDINDPEVPVINVVKLNYSIADLALNRGRVIAKHLVRRLYHPVIQHALNVQGIVPRVSVYQRTTILRPHFEASSESEVRAQRNEFT